MSTDYEGIVQERIRFREIFPRLVTTGHEVRLVERELLKTYHQTLVDRFGSDHEEAQQMRKLLEHVDEVIERYR